MAIKGIAQFYRDRKRHIITSQTDHKCVLDSCRHLQQAGWDITYLPVRPDGLVDMAQLEVRAARPRPRAAQALSRILAGGHSRRHRAGVHHGHQQRNRRHAASGRDRSSLPQARRVLPHRRRAGCGQSAVGRQCAEHRRHVDQRPQGGCLAPAILLCQSLTAAPNTRFTGPRAWVPFTCAGGRACGSSRSSTAAGRSAACVAGRCRRRSW